MMRSFGAIAMKEWQTTISFLRKMRLAVSSVSKKMEYILLIRKWVKVKNYATRFLSGAKQFLMNMIFLLAIL